MSTIDYLYKDLPAYYPTMYLDGYTPEQILVANRQSMVEQMEDEQDITDIQITGEVKEK